MKYILRSDPEKKKFKLLVDAGDHVASELAEGATDLFWLVNVAKSGSVSLKPVTQGKPKTQKQMTVSVSAEAGGQVIGSAVAVKAP